MNGNATVSSERITIEPGKILKKIEDHRAEIARLNALLDMIAHFREFAVEMSEASKVGRPRQDDSIESTLRAFVSNQTDEFTSFDLREAVGEVDRHQLYAAIQRLCEERVLEVLDSPVGRRPGRYRRIAG